MCKELTDELDNGKRLAIELAQHLLGMGAGKASIPVQIDADTFLVTVEQSRLTPLPPDACGGVDVGDQPNVAAGAGEAYR
jgi:hypothetical protein